MRDIGKILAAATAVAAALAFTAPASAAELSGTLRVGTWGGSWKDAVHQHVGAKLEAQGVKIEYIVGNPEDHIAKLVAARGREAPFDVFEGGGMYVDDLVKEGLLEKLDLAKIPNGKALPEFARSDYSLTTLWAQEGIVYNPDKFKELGIAPPKKYSDLANPKLKGHVAFPEVGTTLSWNPLVALAKEAGGDESTIDKGIEMVNKIDPLYFYRASTELATKFGVGDVWAAPWLNGWATRLKRQNLNVAFAHPQVGDRLGAIYPTTIHIAKGAKNTAAAQAFINLYVSPEVSYAFNKQVGYAPTNPEAQKKMVADPEAELLLLKPEQTKNFFLINWTKMDRAKWRDEGNRKLKR